MKNLELKYRITLFLIARIESSGNSYGLIKWLSWRFKILETLDIIDFLVGNQLINRQLNSNGISNYSITVLGISTIQGIEELTYRELIQEYGESNEYVRVLFPEFA